MKRLYFAPLVIGGWAARTAAFIQGARCGRFTGGSLATRRTHAEKQRGVSTAALSNDEMLEKVMTRLDNMEENVRSC
eukprot:43038-Eustigmatos_ZCMA.PRE.1